MPTFCLPRQIARNKGCRTEKVYNAIKAGSLRATAIPTPSGRQRFLITESEAKRWNPPRRQRAKKTRPIIGRV